MTKKDEDIWYDIEDKMMSEVLDVTMKVKVNWREKYYDGPRLEQAIYKLLIKAYKMGQKSKKTPAK